MSHSGRIAVLIPAYNGAQVIGECLEAVLAQTHGDLRIVISDDASSDDTIGVCQSVAGGDARVEIHRSAENLGWVGNINRLLDLVVEDQFAIMPQDDVIAPSYLERLGVELSEHRRVVCAYTDIAGYGDRSMVVGYEPWPGSRSERVRAFVSEWPAAVPYRGLTRRRVLDAGLRVRHGDRNSFQMDTIYVAELLGLGALRRVPESLYRKRFDAGTVISGWAAYPDLRRAWAEHTMASMEVLEEMFRGRGARRRVVAASLDRLVRLFRFEWDARSKGYPAFKRAVEAAAGRGGKAGRSIASARVDLARGLLQHAAGRHGKARRLVQQAIARDRTYAEARVLLARIHAAAGESVAAGREIDRAVAAEPWNQWVRLGASHALASLGDHAAALLQAEAASGLGSLLPAPLLEVGALRKRVGDDAGSAAALRRAVELDPAHPDTRRRLSELGGP